MQTFDEELDQIRQNLATASLEKAGLHGVYQQATCQLADQLYESVKNGRGVWLWGLPGRGKTYTAAAIVKRYVDKAQNAKLVSVIDLLNNLKEGFNKTNYFDLAGLYKLDLLVLDDVGCEKSTSWSQEVLTGLVDKRINLQKPTIYTSNYRLKDALRVWQPMSAKRFASRVAGSCDFIEITADHDLRIKHGNPRAFFICCTLSSGHEGFRQQSIEEKPLNNTQNQSVYQEEGN
ncbi:ATP-binding protein [Atopobium deltae]|uniref:IstB-like ATP-binding domain-containing protein n=1 Tax=Atopobium deltae TaxID=1393034 RepID=A0A133XU83_9ACTN|nr:ATP-binding protein [Atopobium deltae]KXB34496.1 hypothetical protein HMPREF3192_00826 [Atopobium deltae]